MAKVLITGISGTLGQALGRLYLQRGYEVVGVTRQSNLQGDYFSRFIVNRQVSFDDARLLLQEKPDILFLNAGQIETETGPMGEPLPHLLEQMTTVNYQFPAFAALAAAEEPFSRPIEVVAIGSIADGAPSAFGPVYHAGKIAVHYFWSGVGPILYHATNGNVRLRLYRPGAIQGPLAWAPVNRLNTKGYKIRAKRVNSAPSAEKVAEKIARWLDRGNKWVGTYDEPLTFRLLKWIHATWPDLYTRLQFIGWRKASKFYKKPTA